VVKHIQTVASGNLAKGAGMCLRPQHAFEGMHHFLSSPVESLDAQSVDAVKPVCAVLSLNTTSTEPGCLD